MCAEQCTHKCMSPVKTNTSVLVGDHDGVQRSRVAWGGPLLDPLPILSWEDGALALRRRFNSKPRPSYLRTRVFFAASQFRSARETKSSPTHPTHRDVHCSIHLGRFHESTGRAPSKICRERHQNCNWQYRSSRTKRRSDPP